MKDERHTTEPREHALRNVAVGFVVGMLIGGLIDLYSGDLGIATFLGMIAGSLLGYRGLPHVHWMEYPPGVLRVVAGAGVLFFLALFSSYYLIENVPDGPLVGAVPYIPILPGLVFAYSIGFALSKLDELQRRIQVEAIAIGFGLTAVVALTVGLLGVSGARQPNWQWVLVTMTAAWLIGKLWTRWKYR